MTVEVSFLFLFLDIAKGQGTNRLVAIEALSKNTDGLWEILCFDAMCDAEVGLELGLG